MPTLAAPPDTAHRQLGPWIRAFLWMVVIFCLSTDSFSASTTRTLLDFWLAVFHIPLSAESRELVHWALRKGAHISEYFVLGILLSGALAASRSRGGWEVCVWVLMGGGAYALLDELHQAFTASRGASLFDVGWDFTGLLISQLWTWFRHGGAKQPVALPSSEA